MFSLNKRIQGGVHPKDTKFLSKESPIESLKTLPPKLTLLLKQHLGQPATPDVSIGQHVKANDLIAHANGRFSAPIHAPLDGVIESIVTTGSQPYIELIPASQQTAYNENLGFSLEEQPQQTLIEAIHNAGLVGMGGAMFPTADKLKLSLTNDIHTLIINGGECEPYLTCDDRLMRERAENILKGIQILLRACKAKKAIIGIEENKPEAIKRMRALCENDGSITVKPLPVLYPMGSEKQMIRALTGQQVPSGKLTSELGIIIQNVGTCEAVYNALYEGQPLTHRAITVSGGSITRPANIWTPVGTPISHLIDQCGGVTTEPQRMILGGPMMGREVTDKQAPITKGSSGLLLLNKNEIADDQPKSCIRCGQCADACPMQLQPLNLFPILQNDKIDAAKDAGVMDCLLCGACSFSCPASLPLTATFGWGKQQIALQTKQEQKADSTRKASEARRIRVEEEAKAKAAAKAAKAAAKAAKASKRAARKPRSTKVETTVEDQK
ncbi:electron transport complex subunit RsxC [Vibrio sp. WJH972]